MDDGFIVAVARWSLDAAEMSRAILDITSNGPVTLLAANTRTMADDLYEYMQVFARGGLMLPLQASEDLYGMKQLIWQSSRYDHDLLYMQYNAEACDTLINMFTGEITNGKYGMLKEYAWQLLPQLIQQKEAADGILLRI